MAVHIFERMQASLLNMRLVYAVVVVLGIANSVTANPVGDVNGDGKADLVWRHTPTGNVAVWLMNGVTLAQGAVVASGVSLEWEIAGIGDVNGDGKADLVWRHTPTGNVAVWLMNGLTLLQGVVVATGVPLEWQIQQVGDLNGDGKADLVWRYADRECGGVADEWADVAAGGCGGYGACLLSGRFSKSGI